MAKPIKADRLIVEDYKEQKSWIGKLLSPINSFMESVVAALNRSLTLKENLAADMLTVQLDGTMPVKLAWTLKARPRAVSVGDVYRKDGASVTLTDAVGIKWSYNQQGQLQVDQVVGITPSSSAVYVVELVAFTG